ncbi:MAG: response regulator, partial [Anaerolineales bacterium]|nr:response regulator [Anaerolineales bacterium]
SLMKLILAKENYNILTANSFQDVTQHLESNEITPINLILLDLMMPDMSGKELFVYLRNHPKTAETPVIILSAVNEIKKRVELLEMGVDDYLVKPCPIDELLARTAIHMQLGQLRREKKLADARIATQAKYLQAINYIGNKAAQYLDLELMMDKVLTAILTRFEFEQCTIYLQDPDSPTQKLDTVASTTPGTLPPPEVLEALEHCVTIIQNNHICIPILRNNISLGVIGITDSINEQTLEDKVQALEALSVQLATAITNAYLFQDIRQHNVKLQIIAKENRRLYEDQAKLLKEKEISQVQLIQSEKMAVAGRLAASMAHEINNPLQAIHSCLQLTTQFELARDKQMEYLLMAEEEVERLINITNRILDFSRPSSDEFELVSINRIISQVMNLASKHLSHQKLTVKQIIDSDVSQVYVIPDQITQVFLHIIMNAIDASPNQGELIIHTTLEDQWVKICFQDSGIGMTADIKQHVFEPFFTTKETQSGLGLTISYSIIQRHRGKIEIETQPGKGTTVAVYLHQTPTP